MTTLDTTAEVQMDTPDTRPWEAHGGAAVGVTGVRVGFNFALRPDNDARIGAPAIRVSVRTQRLKKDGSLSSHSPSWESLWFNRIGRDDRVPLNRDEWERLTYPLVQLVARSFAPEFAGDIVEKLVAALDRVPLYGSY